ncbi:hypothetical protein BB559_002118 [Furculomyces boomerangus]|uniref:Peptidase S1 domain-containing protein n=1 Tax=Furculomyces boomerangus TaxID=61424 RepID=A0A2T9YY08_9FUNG|nr:hypothetical protein BB559_002118 [Furculomyces boomerangus]
MPGSERIVNGFQAKITDFPYIAFIYIDLKTTGEACAGTLISNNVVLTAAHCMYDDDQKLFSAKSIFISVGSQYNIEKNTNVYYVDKLVPNPKYSSRTAANDIGLIFLKTNVNIPNVIPAKIYNQNVVDGLPASAAGWGVTSNDPNATISPVLMTVPLQISSSPVCKKLNPIWTSNQGSSICTLNVNGQDTCYGDSGGPLAYTGDSSRPLIGITSIGNAPGSPDHPPCGSAGGAAYYTNVLYFIDWVSSTSGISKSTLLFQGTTSNNPVTNLKKSWHPLTFKNQERIWKEKQNAEAEKKKIQQIQKELHRERQQEEFLRLQEAAGIRQANNRLEWMYAAPASSGQVANEDLEDYLLGKKNINNLINAKDSNELKQKLSSDIFEASNQNANSSRDIMAKIREDPLLAIKKREQEIIKATINNPLKMSSLMKAKKKSKRTKSKDENPDDNTKTTKKHKDRSDSSKQNKSSKKVLINTKMNIIRKQTKADQKRGKSRDRSMERDKERKRYRSRERKGDGLDIEAKKLEERKAKLEEMMRNANKIETERLEFVSRINKEQEIEEKQLIEEQMNHSKRGTTTSYLKEITDSAYGQLGNITLEERLQRNRNFLSKDALED